MDSWYAGRSKGYDYEDDEAPSGGSGCLLNHWYDIFLLPFYVLGMVLILVYVSAAPFIILILAGILHLDESIKSRCKYGFQRWLAWAGILLLTAAIVFILIDKPPVSHPARQKPPSLAAASPAAIIASQQPASTATAAPLAPVPPTPAAAANAVPGERADSGCANQAIKPGTYVYNRVLDGVTQKTVTSVVKQAGDAQLPVDECPGTAFNRFQSQCSGWGPISGGQWISAEPQLIVTALGALQATKSIKEQRYNFVTGRMDHIVGTYRSIEWHACGLGIVRAHYEDDGTKMGYHNNSKSDWELVSFTPAGD